MQMALVMSPWLCLNMNVLEVNIQLWDALLSLEILGNRDSFVSDFFLIELKTITLVQGVEQRSLITN